MLTFLAIAFIFCLLFFVEGGCLVLVVAAAVYGALKYFGVA